MKQSWDKHCENLNAMGDVLTELMETIPDSMRNVKIKNKLKKVWAKVRISTNSMDQFVSPVKSIKVDSPWQTDKFQTAWQFWKDYLNEQHGFIMRSRMEVKQLKRLAELSANDPDKAIRILDVAEAGGYTRIFKIDEEPEKENNNAKKFSLNAYKKN